MNYVLKRFGILVVVVFFLVGCGGGGSPKGSTIIPNKNVDIDLLDISVQNGLKQEIPFTLNPSISNLPKDISVKWILDRKEIAEGIQIDTDGYHSLGAKLYKDSKLVKTIMTDLYGYTSKIVATFDAKKSSSSGVYIFEEDSDKLSGAEIDIPADVLLKDTIITLKETSIDKIPKTLGMPVSKVLKLEPEGLTFNTPITITIPYDILDFNDVVVARYSNGVVDYIKPLYVDKVHKKVVFQTKHFTEFQLQTSWGFEKRKVEQSEIKDIETTLGLKYSSSEWEKMLNHKLYKDLDLTYYDVWLAYNENSKIREKLNKKKYTESIKIAYPDSLSKMRKKIKSIEEAVSALGYVEMISSFDIKKPIRSAIMVITGLFDISNDPKSAYLPPNELVVEQYNKIQTLIDDITYEAIWDDFSSGYSMEQIRNSDVFTSLKDIVDDAMLKNLKIVFDRDKNFNKTTSLSHIKKLFESLHEEIEFDKKELNIELSGFDYTFYTDKGKVDIKIYLSPLGYGSDYKSSNPKLIIYNEKQKIKEMDRYNLLYDDEKDVYFATLSLNIPKMADTYQYKILYSDDKGVKKEKKFFLKTEDRVVQDVTISKYEMKNQHYYKNGVFTAVLKPSFNQSNIHYAYTIKIGSLTYEGFSEVRSLSYDQIANIEILGIDKIIDGTDNRATQEDLRNIKIEFEVMETNYKLVGKNTFVFNMNEVINNYVKKDIYTPEFVASTDEGMIEMPHDIQKIPINTNIYFSEYFDSKYYKLYAHDIDGNGIFSKIDNPNYSYVFKHKGLYHPCIWIQNRQTLAKEKYCSVSFEVIDDISKIEIKTNTPPNKPTIVQNKRTLTANSTDADGDDLKYIWKVISGDITLNHSYGKSVTYSTGVVADNVLSSYTVEVFAHDGYNKSEPKQYTFTLNGATKGLTFVSENLVSNKTNEYEDILQIGQTVTKTWKVKNNSSKDLTNVKLSSVGLSSKLTSATITPSQLSTWTSGETKTFSVELNANESLSEGIYEQRWNFTADGQTIPYLGGSTQAYLSYKLKVEQKPVEIVIPKNLKATASIQGIRLTWDSVAGAASYTLAKSLDPFDVVDGVVDQNSDYVIVNDIMTNSYLLEDSSLFENRNYTFAISAKDGKFSQPVTLIWKVQDTPVTSTSKVLKTGQTTSYTNFDDGDYQKGLTRSYTRANNIVTDNVTGLMWQDNEEARIVHKPWVTPVNYDAKKYMDTSGDTATTYCHNLTLGGFSNWRLPTRKELVSLSDYGRYNPAINSNFKNVAFYPYWSSTTFTGPNDSYSSWSVSFVNGEQNHNNIKEYRLQVRCVRVGGS